MFDLSSTLPVKLPVVVDGIFPQSNKFTMGVENWRLQVTQTFKTALNILPGYKNKTFSVTHLCTWVEKGFPGDFWESQGNLIDSYSIGVRIQCSGLKPWPGLSSSTRKSTLTVPPSALGYKWVPVNLQWTHSP